MQFSKEDAKNFSVKLWDLLKLQAWKYNGIDSTSMPAEKAQELLSSLIYTISVVVKEDGLIAEKLLHSDLSQVIKRGHEILDNRRKIGTKSWKRLCLESPNIQNGYYVDTMENLGLFFKQYNIYYEAHEIPCSIDYPLLNPIMEELQGITFIEEYMRRIRIESNFLSCFHLNTVTSYFSSINLGYKDDYFNLCESVLIGAIGRTLLGYELNILTISREDVGKLYDCLKGKTEEEIFIIISKAVDLLCRTIDFDMSRVSYFIEEVKSLTGRIVASLETDNLVNVFIPI